jgi:DNA-directed RNA polymerase sigma subunit (sigma70/sigma32)
MMRVSPDGEPLVASLRSLAVTPEEKLIESQSQSTIMEAMKFLTDREFLIIDLIYGLTLRESKTRVAVAQELCVGPERVRQIECRAIRKLKHPDCFRNLRHLLADYDK